jgi:hypothetical protein
LELLNDHWFNPKRLTELPHRLEVRLRPSKLKVDQSFRRDACLLGQGSLREQAL